MIEIVAKATDRCDVVQLYISNIALENERECHPLEVWILGNGTVVLTYSAALPAVFISTTTILTIRNQSSQQHPIHHYIMADGVDINEKIKASHKVTAESYGAVDIRHIHQECWMLRVPPKLAQIWQDASEGSAIGQLVLTKGSKKPPGVASAASKQQQQSVQKTSITVQLDSSLEGVTSDTPLAYSLQAMTSKLPLMIPFTRRPNASIQVHGTVTRTANLQVDSTDERYRQLTRNRLLQTNVDRSRFVKPVEANELSVKKSSHVALARKGGEAAATASAGFGDAVQEYGKRKLEATELLNSAGGLAAAAAATGTTVATTAKRLKSSAASTAAQFEGQTTRSVMFALFSQQPYWTVKDLRVASGGRLEKDIRDILRDIGEYHRSGEHKNMWQLRPEFQQQS